jgi:lipoprotein-anchoring transpeptidase ErfK/SrfK
VRPRVHYSRSAVAGFVDSVKRDLDRPPLDAKVNFPSLSRVKEREGIEVYEGELTKRVTGALSSTGRRVVAAPVRTSQPKVTRAQLADNYPRLIVVDRSAFRLRFYERLRLVKTYRISVGMVGLETPAGLHRVKEKAKDPAWQVPDKPWAGELAGRLIPGGTPDNPLKERWLGVGKGIGMHGTDETWSLGNRASHGCIRMAIPDVIELYRQVPLKTPVYIG